MTGGFRWWMLAALLLALALRGVQLNARPMHTDEAVKATLIFRPLWEGEGYRYDPDEHHGPTLAYSTLAWGKLTLARDFARWTETRLRSMTVLYGLGLILLLPLIADGLGRNAALVAAFLTAVSPMMVYYSRDYIHESLFVFFSFLALVAGWRYARTRKFGWILLTGAAVGLMQATKETFIFNLAAAAAALFLNRLFTRRPAVKQTKPLPPIRPAYMIAGVAAWLVVALLFYSSFFSNASGPLDALRAYLPWSHRAAGASPHIHAWTFYWHRLLFFHVKGAPVWSEALIFALAIGGGIAAFGRQALAGANAALARFLVFYTGILAAIYTAIPYKTPWCALGFWHGAILLAGIGAVELVSRLHSPRLKLTAKIVLLTGIAQLAFQAWLAAVPDSAIQGNPWAYAQTSPDLLNLVDKVDTLAKVSTDDRGLRMNVIAPESDYEPLPWYFRQFSDVYNGAGWYDEVPGYSKFETDELDVNGSSTFSADDIKEWSAIVDQWRGRSNAVSAFLWDGLSNQDQIALTNYQQSASSSNEAQAVIVQALNRIIKGTNIDKAKRFQGISLRPETTNLMNGKPTGLSLERLNRLLLEDAYPRELSRNHDGFAAKLRAKSDPVSRFLMDSGLEKYVDAYQPSRDGAKKLEAILDTNLNRILEGPSIYDSNRFQGVVLRPETQALRAQNPEGQDLIRLNRMLLEDAYPNEISRNLPPEPYPPVTIVSAKLDEDVDADKAGVMAGLFALRPGVFLELFVQTNLWSAYLQRAVK